MTPKGPPKNRHDRNWSGTCARLTSFGRLRTSLGSLLAPLGSLLAPFWPNFGDSGTILASFCWLFPCFWPHFRDSGTILASFWWLWHHFGLLLVTFWMLFWPRRHYFRMYVCTCKEKADNEEVWHCYNDFYTNPTVSCSLRWYIYFFWWLLLIAVSNWL